MSSRVLRGEVAERVETLDWTRLGQQAEAPRTGGRPEMPGDARIIELTTRIATLENERAAIEQRAYQAGLQEAQTAARRQAEAAIDAAVERLAQAVSELARQKREIRRQAEEDVVRLAVAIARRVLNRQLAVDPAVLLGIVKAALDRVDASEVTRLRVHPDHAALVEAHLRAAAFPGAIQVTGDPSLASGGAILETPTGQIDASVDSQLQEIERGLCDRLRRPSLSRSDPS